jgi:hypothetical protein
MTLADPDGDMVADAEQLPPARVVELDPDSAHADKLARLPRPREVLEGVAAEPAGEDRLERRLLLLARALVEIEDPRPG